MVRNPRTPQFLLRHTEPPRPAAFASSDVTVAIPCLEDELDAIDETPMPRPPPPPPVAAPPPPTPMPDLNAANMERVGHALATLRLQTHALAESVRADALEIGFQVARAILEQEVTADVTALMSLVKSAIRKVAESRKLTVRVSSVDLPLLEASLQQGHVPELTAAQVDLVADPTLKRGDVVVEGDLGTVDGRLETRLAEVRRTLAPQLQQDPA
jgi:flagellar assembly protein FliH